ncbi:hypothetical protein Tco_0302706 [Tanacetum coccineum]
MVREIVEEARIVKPLDISLNYACRYTKLSQELLECVIGTATKSFNEEITRLPYHCYEEKAKLRLVINQEVNDSMKQAVNA